MKNNIILILSIIIIIFTFIVSRYYEYKREKSEIDKFNLIYNRFIDKEIKGTDIATIINKAVDDNENAFIKKDEKGLYIQNDESSVNIEVKITDIENGKIYKMETLYDGGINEFIKYYGQIAFKCTNVEYNSKKHIKYMLFEQISS